LDKGTTLPSLVKKDLITITMSYPKSKEEQKCIVTQLNDLQTQTKKLETIYQHKINNLVELKKTILSFLFVPLVWICKSHFRHSEPFLKKLFITIILL
jgi:restriction endonuclease S subunit